MEAAEVKVEEIEEEEGGRVVERNLTMISSMLGHTRLPGQQDDEVLDVMMVGTVGDVEQDGGSHSGADLLTGVFFSLLVQIRFVVRVLVPKPATVGWPFYRLCHRLSGWL